MTEVLWVVLIFLALVNGVTIGYCLSQAVSGRPAKKVESSPEDTLPVEELERIRKEREELKAEQAAFLKIVGYNADIAYGLDQNPLEGS